MELKKPHPSRLVEGEEIWRVPYPCVVGKNSGGIAWKQRVPAPYMVPGTSLAAASLDSQLGFVWESSISAQVAAISDCVIAQAGWPRAKHRWGQPRTCTTQEIPGNAYPVNSYRPHQSTTTLSLNS